ncbi:hypothetical protein BaRGS_00015917 [Batillaria attramentaria]|uniref:Uncharacterized protein n=1 Tax=Batillaria attramentaria TaxID=370345 RepID=A0ABD0KZW9_9CAEN
MRVLPSCGEVGGICMELSLRADVSAPLLLGKLRQCFLVHCSWECSRVGTVWMLHVTVFRTVWVIVRWAVVAAVDEACLVNFFASVER